MALTINTSPASLIAHRALAHANSGAATSLERLSTGLRINRASDDPAGLIAATSLTADISKLAANQTGDDRLFTKAGFTEAIFGVVSDVLQQAKSITVADANGAGATAEERDAHQLALDAIIDGIERIGIGTTFAGEKTFGDGVMLRSDASGAGVGIGSLSPDTLGRVRDPLAGKTYTFADLRSGGELSGGANREMAAQVVDAAIKQLADRRAELGSFQQTLLSMGNVRGVTLENLREALSRTQDANVAEEVASLARNQTLANTSLAAGAMANTTANTALSLLR